MGKTLTNKINAILLKIENEEYVEARNQLENDVKNKTDGCANSGEPDKNDWIEDCESQGQVYPIIVESISLLTDIIDGLAKKSINGNVELTDESHPTAYQLAQNYPNPFNPTTTISFSLPEHSYVVIKVYDTIGQEVVTLVNEQKSAGRYSVEWNGKSKPSGLYFYRITAGSYKKTNKMLLIK